MNPPDQPTGIIGQTCGQPLHDLVHRTPTPTLAPTPRPDAAALDLGHASLAGDRWMRGPALKDPIDECVKAYRKLAAAEAKCERFRLCTLKQDAELALLRAEVQRRKTVAATMLEERDPRRHRRQHRK
jgi:hypothetical protein